MVVAVTAVIIVPLLAEDELSNPTSGLHRGQVTQTIAKILKPQKLPGA